MLDLVNMFFVKYCLQCYYGYLQRRIVSLARLKKTAGHRKKFGDVGEALARAYLRLQGLRIVAANWRHDRSGELDIVAASGSVLVFCEVKTRSRCDYARPLRAVNALKRRLIRKAAKHCLAQHRGKFSGFRFDIIEISVLPGCRPQLLWHKNAFSLRGK